MNMKDTHLYYLIKAHLPVLRGTYYYIKLVPPSRKAYFHSLEKRKRTTLSDTNYVFLDLVLFSDLLVHMNTGSADGSQQQQSSSNQSTRGKDATKFFKKGGKLLTFALFIYSFLNFLIIMHKQDEVIENLRKLEVEVMVWCDL